MKRKQEAVLASKRLTTRFPASGALQQCDHNLQASALLQEQSSLPEPRESEPGNVKEFQPR